MRHAVRVIFKDVFGRGFLQDVLMRVDQKSARPRGKVANALLRLRVEHLHHHADDVTRRAELSIAPRDAQMTEQVLVQVALHILVLLADLHLVDQLTGFDQQTGLVDLTLGGLHVLAEGIILIRQFG